jgi:hypothetical protein
VRENRESVADLSTLASSAWSSVNSDFNLLVSFDCFLGETKTE